MNFTAAITAGGLRYRGGAGNVAIVGQYGNVHLKNPAGSNVVALVYRIRLENQAGGTINSAAVWGYYNPDLAGAVYSSRSPMDQRQTGNSLCLIGANTDPSVLVTPAFYLDRCALPISANIVDERGDGEEVAIVTPGTGLLIHCTFQNSNLGVTFRWIELRTG